MEEIQLCGRVGAPESGARFDPNYKPLIKMKITRKHHFKRNLDWKNDCTCYLRAQFIAGVSLRVGNGPERYEILP